MPDDTPPNPREVAQALATLRAAACAPADGLPEEVFLFVSSVTPLVNVDLLIRDAAGRVLLTWRHDAFYGPGWHVPGGIIRFKEAVATRIAAVAAAELGAGVRFESSPLCSREIIHPDRAVRGHFFSLLHACSLTSPPDPARRHDGPRPKHGDWAWHERCPDDLIAVHETYRPYLDGYRGTPVPHHPEGRQRNSRT
jgi:colanic acid biosynthesis protein WcaH